MMRTTAAICLMMSACVLGLSRAGERQPPATPVLLVPAAKSPLRLRLDVTIDGRPPAAAWDAFLDALFDYFERDGNGSLSRVEVSRMVHLPLPGNRELAMDFIRLDTDGDAQCSRAELKAFCRAHGFGPVVIVAEPPSDADVRVGRLFFRRLDADGDGKLTRTELRNAPQSLRGFDLNEDEFLERSELGIAADSKIAGGMATHARLSQEDGCDAALRLDVGARAGPATITRPLAKSMRLVSAASDRLQRLHGPGGRWALSWRAARNLADVQAAGGFLIALFEEARGDRPALRRADIDDNAALSGLRALFQYADRNGDDLLTRAEIEGYLRLVAAGVRSQLWVRAIDRGPNPFDFLDTDGDGRLSYREQAQASDLLHPDLSEIDHLPAQFHLSFGGPNVRSWGGVPIPAIHKHRAAPANTAAPAPRWFTAMDRNSDGVISPREFLGPPELFRKLDANGDGVITPDEAIRAGAR
jgi:Ca2+-binding EF-hand superfamily protein